MQLHILTWNVQGLRSPQKRSKILRHLHTLKVDIAFLQETHLPEKDFFRLKKLWVGEEVGSPAIGKKGEVITLIRKNKPFHITNTNSDNHERRITLTLTSTGSQCNESIKFTNLYAPNFPNKDYFHTLTNWFLRHTI